MAAKDEENTNEVPTYPKYKIGGWMANAGSCKIGLSPRPSVGVGNKYSKGFEVKIIKSKNPNMITSWNTIVNNL